MRSLGVEQDGGLLVREIRGPQEPGGHQGVGNGHRLAKNLFRPLHDADVVSQALRHLLHAIEPHEQRVRHDQLRFLPLSPLEFPRGEEIEFLVGAADLDVRPHHDRVPGLHDRVEQFVHADRGTRGQAPGEVVALDGPRHGHPGGELYHVRQGHLLEPLAIPPDLGVIEVNDPAHLLEVGLRVGVDLLSGQDGTGLVRLRRVPHPRGVITDDDDREVPEFLEHAKLVQRDRVAQVDIRRGGIHAVLDPEGTPFCLGAAEPLGELALGQDLLRDP